MSTTDKETSAASVTLYPTSLSDNFEAKGGSEYHIIQAIKSIKANLAILDDATGGTELQNQMNWVVEQLSSLAYTAGVEASEYDIEEIVNQRIDDRNESDAIERNIRGY